ncbi:MAG: DsbA family oxidoreductase [Rhizobiales bacterium]|nr:DsbA family oxidoreductase [Hyphomicrobiales bacterium]
MNAPVTIDVVSDVVCPWCFLGKRRLDKAVAALPSQPVQVRWRPFQLDPTIPKGGVPRQAYLEAKFGPARLAELHKPLVAAGEREGIDYAFDKIKVTPNSLDAHRLIRWAHTHNLQSEMVERLFSLYWLEGADIGAREVLIRAAVDVGLDGTLVAQLLQSEADLDAVIAELNQASEIGITGVPTYILAGRYGVVGAQSSEVLSNAITRAAKESQATP